MARHTMTDDENKKAGLAPYCPCGSGGYREAQYDARGIFLCYTCDTCESRKLKGYRREVLTNPNYEADEAIDGD